MAAMFARGRFLILGRVAAGLLLLSVSTVHAQDAGSRRAAAGAAVTAEPPPPSLQQTVLELLQQIESLNVEVRQLRNQVEIQINESDQQKARHRSSIEDFDKRIRRLEQPPETPVAAPVPPTPPSAGRPVTVEQQKEYDKAFLLIKAGQYEAAAREFRGFLGRHPESGLADNAYYWVGESHYALKHYPQALEAFTRVVTSYPGSPKLADALVKVGYVQHELGNLDAARKALQDVVSRFPGTTVARLAQARLDKIGEKR